MPQVRNHNTAADHQGNIESIHQLIPVKACLRALLQMVVDAVVAPQNSRGDRPQKFFSFSWNSTFLISIMIQIEKTFYTQMVMLQHELILLLSLIPELFKTVQFSWHVAIY